jgi:hypothetical protein
MADINPRKIPVRGVLIGTIVLVLFVLFGSPFFMANVWIHGEEFCPQLFQKRNFHYWRLPGTKFRISSTTLSPAVSPCSKSILQTLVTAGATDWQVSKVGYGSVVRDLGPQILIDYLEAKDANGANIWDAWSFRNSQQAAVLWPIVQQVAIQEMYHCVPDLLRTANGELDVNRLDKNLRMACLQAVQAKRKALQESKNADRETELRRWVLELTDDYQEDLEFAKIREEFAET